MVYFQEADAIVCSISKLIADGRAAPNAVTPADGAMIRPMGRKESRLSELPDGHAMLNGLLIKKYSLMT